MVDRKNLLESTALTGVTPLVASEIQPPPSKRPKKIEVKYRGRVYVISGEKGGVGKTICARCLVEVLIMAGFLVRPVEADAANCDIERAFNLAGHINLQKDSGYMDLLDHIQSIPDDHDIVVSLPAGALAGAKVRGKFFTTALQDLSKELGREVVVIWPIDDKIVSVEMLNSFVTTCPGVHVDVMQNAFFFDEFSFYEKSETKKLITAAMGKTLKFPRCKPEVMQEIVNKNLRFTEALGSFSLGPKCAFQDWLNDVREAFKSVGYLTRGVN